MAKLAIASGLGPEGRGFKSHQPEYKFQPKAGRLVLAEARPLAGAIASGLGPEDRGFQPKADQPLADKSL